MSRVCTVCAHTDRQAVDEAIVLGRTLRDIAQQHGVSKDAVSRHKAHVSPALARLVADRAEAGPKSALSRLEELYGRASNVLSAAESEGKASLSLAAIRELRGIVETLAKITGELDERSTVQVLNLATSDEWLVLRAAVMSALADYPEAAAAVAGRLTGGARVAIEGRAL